MVDNSPSNPLGRLLVVDDEADLLQALVSALETDGFDVTGCPSGTAALDPELIGEVLEVMKQLAHDGMTMLVVTHEMSFAREVADRVLYMEDGQIIEDAPPEVLFTNPKDPRCRQFLERVRQPG